MGLTDVDALKRKIASVAKLAKSDQQKALLGRVLFIVQNAPTVEPKRGRWIHVSGYCTLGGDPVWRCSECGKGMHVYGVEHGTYGADISDGQWVACPNCGANMKGDDEDAKS